MESMDTRCSGVLYCTLYSIQVHTYCHEAMHVQQRMQDAGWSADVERWESDEDSDGSGDEGDRDVVEGLQLSEATVRLLMA